MSPSETRSDAAHPGLTELLRLTLIPGLGPATLRALLEHAGPPEKAARLSERQLRAIPGIGPKLAARISAARHEVEPEIELALCREHNTRLLALDDTDYPPRLRQISDPPPLLYCRGAIEPADECAIAIVGSRRCTPYGMRIAERLARSLARAGLTVVSGLARGIDAAAHRGALAAGGRTFAVLANGLCKVYPPEHEALAAEISNAGAILSEMPMRQEPIAGLFPQRNRIIAGLCLGVVVVEAAPRSGSLLTVQHAAEQNREVFAVPGPIDSLASRGCHQLIREGAKLVETVDDILEELEPGLRERFNSSAADSVSQPTDLHAPTTPLLSERERQVLGLLDTVPRAVDELIAATGLAASQVLATLSVLEMRRLARRVPGNLFVRI